MAGYSINVAIGVQAIQGTLSSLGGPLWKTRIRFTFRPTTLSEAALTHHHHIFSPVLYRDLDPQHTSNLAASYLAGTRGRFERARVLAAAREVHVLKLDHVHEIGHALDERFEGFASGPAIGRPAR